MVEIYLPGPQFVPEMSLGGITFHCRTGTYKYKPRAKEVTERRSLSNQRRRQIGYGPREWDMTAIFSTRTDMETMETLFASETYASYTHNFYDGHRGQWHVVTFDAFEPDVIMDYSQRWDAKMHLIEWI